MDPVVFATVVAAVSPFMVALFTWVTRRGLERRAAEAQERAEERAEFELRLTQQREDFQALLSPLQDTVRSLRERVAVLEAQAGEADRNVKRLVRGLEQVLEYLREKYQDDGPELSPQVGALLWRGRE